MEPCITHRCSKCCLMTEMLLSNNDVCRLKGLGYIITDFLLEDDGWLQLKNKKGVCTFLANGLCSIYNHRPMGCLFYPLIYDDTRNYPLLDDSCPYKDEFKFTSDEVELLLHHIGILKEERGRRIQAK